MKQSTWHIYYIILLMLLAFITLGAIGNAAIVVDKFYWFPFVINLGLYVVIAFKLYKNMKKLEKEDR